ncbi:MAG: arginine--tRNA ligase [Phycisphaerales bacterium]|nr:arginine--tRNA ligase [Phycisphaerales bacterium]
MTVVSDPVARLEEAVRDAVLAVGGEHADGVDAALKPSAKPEFGDFQLNAAMALAKKLGEKPRDIATRIAEQLSDGSLSEIIAEPEIAGPGFINLTLKSSAIAAALLAMDNEHHGIEPATNTHGVTIDVCGVNVAKQMHVGHLRSTVIGDTIARLFERLGRTVHRQNHLGDWGLPIAMTLQSLRSRGVNLEKISLDDLNIAYRDAQLNARGDARGLAAARANGCGPHRIAELEVQEDSARAAGTEARDTLVRLQSGDPELVADWRKLIEITMQEVYEACTILNTRIGPDSEKGESSFREELAPTVQAFIDAGLAEEDDGALVVRFDDRERPLLIRKRDGGFLYATTDLAALRFRMHDLDSDEVIYVVDARQRDHFRDVFDAVRKIGWATLPDGTDVELVHLGFGTVLGPDRKPLKTRSGTNFTLKDLLDEAIERGTREVQSRAQDPHSPTHKMSEEELEAIGRAVGIGAIKYADLGSGANKDYLFDLDRMISFEGDTGPYIQYAHARICSMISKIGETAEGPFRIETPEERRLALELLKFPRTVQEAARQLEPSRLCRYLYGLAGEFSGFYQACPVLRAEDDDTRLSRLRLSSLTRDILRDGLDQLGIEAPMRM